MLLCRSLHASSPDRKMERLPTNLQLHKKSILGKILIFQKTLSYILVISHSYIHAKNSQRLLFFGYRTHRANTRTRATANANASINNMPSVPFRYCRNRTLRRASIAVDASIRNSIRHMHTP